MQENKNIKKKQPKIGNLVLYDNSEDKDLGIIIGKPNSNVFYGKEYDRYIVQWCNSGNKIIYLENHGKCGIYFI